MVVTLAMTEAQRQLYRKIQSFALDEPNATFPLSRRLARENGWSSNQVQRAIAEYKKFAFLAVATDHPVSPSDAVDQVWHLHLLYTHSYWECFCGDVLGKPLHHQPSLGGRPEQDKFEDWYTKTLESYERFFGPAPADFWPAPDQKAAQQPQYQWVDRKQYWTLPKPSQWGAIISERAQAWNRPLMRWTVVSVGVMLLWTLTADAALAQTALNPLNYRGPEFLSFYGGLSALCWAGASGVRFFAHRAAGNSVDESEADLADCLDLYEAAYLADGERRVVETAIAKLAMAEVVSIDEQGQVSRMKAVEASADAEASAVEASSHPMETAITDLVRDEAFSIRSLMGQVGVSRALQPLRDGLIEQGLLISPEQRSQMQRRSAVIMAIPLLMGLCKIFVGLSRMKPVGFLVIACIATAIAAYWMFTASVRQRTGKGDRVLDQMLIKQKEAILVDRTSKEVAAVSQAFALQGPTALTGTLYACLVPGLTYVPTYGNLGRTSASGCGGGCSSSCGSGCGSSCGGGCGGGCGGCGG